MAGRTVIPIIDKNNGGADVVRRVTYSSRGEFAVSRAIRSATPVTHSVATT